MYCCLKYNNDASLVKNCWQLKEDGHCLYCPFYQSDVPIEPASDEIKKRTIERFIEIANITLKKGQ